MNAVVPGTGGGVNGGPERAKIMSRESLWRPENTLALAEVPKSFWVENEVHKKL